MRSFTTGFALLLALLSGGPAQAWSRIGHELVATLAESRLTPAADAKVRELLRGEPNPTLAGVAMWADDLRASDPERFKATARWHYVNFEGGSCELEAANCTDGACVVGAINAQLKLLADSSQPLAVRRDALKFVVHLVGDVHQPMHASNRSDRGGNDFPIRLRTDLQPEEYARSKYVDGVMDTNLHSVWDYYVLGSEKLDVPAYSRKLAALRWPRAPQRTVAAWATESCQLIDRRALYPPVHELDAAYLDSMRPLAEQRVEIAARRLARLLNSALAPG